MDRRRFDDMVTDDEIVGHVYIGCDIDDVVDFDAMLDQMYRDEGGEG